MTVEMTREERILAAAIIMRDGIEEMAAESDHADSAKAAA